MKWKRIFAAALAAALLFLSACGQDEPQSTDEPYIEGELDGTELGALSGADNVFSLNTKAEDGFNPYVTANADNLLVDQLVYENIYELDDNYNLSSRIVTDAYTEDGVYWYFTVDTSIVMHDGENLTAYDVAYSLQRAMISRRYAGRFIYVWGASAQSDTQFAVTLSQANMQFPKLMTVPVIKNGSIGENHPAGCGPFVFAEDGASLVAFPQHVNYESLPVSSIGLVEYDSVEDVITAYEDAYIDLVVNDPSGARNLGYGGGNEWRYISTTNMHYFGFNLDAETGVGFVNFSSYRYAMQFAVDREYAAKTLMKGAALAAAIPLSPRSPMYDADYAARFSFDPERCLLIMNNGGADDYDQDGKLEYMLTGIPMEIELDLIVCSESSGKADIATRFAEELGNLGITVIVRELSWDEYVRALEDGDFDIYYAEVKLTPDFNLTRLLSEDGALNYGAIEDETYLDYINQYLSATEEEREYFLYQLFDYLTDNAPIIPICFERQEVITHRSVVTGLEPSASNVFRNFANWSINLD